MPHTRISLTALALLSLHAAHALDIQVPGDQATIQAAIAAAGNGDKIIVAPGTYQESIDFGGKNVEVASAAGNQLTVLDMTGTGGISMGPAGALVGFTIRNGKLEDGGAVTVEGAGSYISGNVFEQNHQVRFPNGSSIFVRFRATPVIEGNVFRANTAQSSSVGSVISLEPDASPLIANNIFHDNESAAVFDIQARPTGAAIIVNNTMVRNLAGIRIAPLFSLPSGQTFNRTIRNNIISGGVVGIQIRGSQGELGIIENNLVYGNDDNYTGGGPNLDPDLTGIDGNISADPQFIDSAASDFRLLATSPAIDAGTNMSAPDFDFDDNPRPEDGDGNGSAITDIGAFEASTRMGVGLQIEGGLEHECNTHGGALLNINVSTNPEDLELASLTILVNDEEVADASPAEIFAPMGVSLIRVEATTGNGTVLEDEQYVSVVDTTPPVLMAWFEDGKTGQPVTAIDSRSMSRIVIRIEADDICDPDPEVDSVLGTPVRDGQPLRIQGNKGQVIFDTEELTLKVTATDHSGNTTSLNTSLELEAGPPPGKAR